MAKEEWGVKRLCPTTGRRFYDLGRTPVISPYTGEAVEIDVIGRKGAISPVAVAKDKRKLAAEAVDGDDELLTDEAGDDLDLDDELLEDEDDDSVALDDLADVADDADDET